MTAPNDLIEVLQVAIAQIKVGARIHHFDEGRVLSLADDIEARGLETPIQLRELPDGSLHLVAGRHRLAAVTLLGWEVVSATVKNMSDEQAICAEIEENQQRGSLTVLERGIGLAALKNIYLKRHPETSHGKHGRGKEDNNVLFVPNSATALGKAVRFTKNEAEKQGVNEKEIKRLVQIGETIPEDLHAEIHGTPLADNQAQLLKLAARPPEDRAALVRTMKDRGVYKVEAARRLQAGIEEPAPLPLEEAWQRKMRALWAGGKKAWQRRFLLAIDAQFAAPEDGDN